MKYYSYFIVLGVVVICGACEARAAQAAIITEVMYDVKDSDADREWIEIDTQSLNIPLDQVRVSVGSSNHLLKSSQNITTIPSNTICIIAQSESKFKNDYPLFTGCIFEASFSLTNTTNKIKLLNKTSGEIYDTVEYVNTMGAAGDGNSLHKVQGVLVAKSPTPGVSSEVSQSSGSTSSGSGSTTTDGQGSSNTSSGPQNPPAVPPSAAPDTFSGSQALVDETSKFTLIMEKPVSVFAFEQIDIPVLVSQIVGKDIRYFTTGNLYISYGDGTIQNIVDDVFKVRHIYRNPSMVTLQMYYFTSLLTDVPDAELTVKILVKPLPLKFSVTGKNDISIFNEDIQDINISGMLLSDLQKSVYEFPYGLIISGRGSVVIHKSTHHLAGNRFLFKDRAKFTIATIEPIKKEEPKVVLKEPVVTLKAEASEITEILDTPNVQPLPKKENINMSWPLYLMIFGLGLLVSWLIEYLIKYLKERQKKSITRDDEFLHDGFL